MSAAAPASGDIGGGIPAATAAATAGCMPLLLPPSCDLARSSAKVSTSSSSAGRGTVDFCRRRCPPASAATRSPPFLPLPFLPPAASSAASSAATALAKSRSYCRPCSSIRAHNNNNNNNNNTACTEETTSSRQGHKQETHTGPPSLAAPRPHHHLLLQHIHQSVLLLLCQGALAANRGRRPLDALVVVASDAAAVVGGSGAVFSCRHRQAVRPPAAAGRQRNAQVASAGCNSSNRSVSRRSVLLGRCDDRQRNLEPRDRYCRSVLHAPEGIRAGEAIRSPIGRSCCCCWSWSAGPAQGKGARGAK